MAEQCEYKSRKKMSTREWVMVCVLIVLVQLLLHYWTSESMNSGEVLAYVSFAGTIVSIILAVLAIIYSFVQTQAQQATSDSISREIFRLTDVATRIDTTSRGVTTAVAELPIVMSQLNELPKDMSNEFKMVISELSSSTMSLHEKTESMKAEILGKLAVIHTPNDAEQHVAANDINYIKYKGLSSLIVAGYIIFSGKGYVSLCKLAQGQLNKEDAERAIFILSRADAANEAYYMMDYLKRGEGNADYVFNDEEENAAQVRMLKSLYSICARSIIKLYEENEDSRAVSKFFTDLFKEDGFNGDSASKTWSS
ncbi:hypothetical protein JD491_04685 [Aeromonas caviae]|uniref:hypothetical protein n=1 Tax=Aeromonas caviae TaxID=648 RepID=UPI001920F36B|nr:hypothetical protein [Aeromonas caviae]MBL0576934.1 hypothetical protein [Aeromonas caviae]